MKNNFIKIDDQKRFVEHTFLKWKDVKNGKYWVLNDKSFTNAVTIHPWTF